MSWLDSLAEHALPLVGNLKKSVRSILVLALIALACALVWALATSAAGAERVIVLAPTGLLVAVATLLLSSASVFQLRNDKASIDPAPGGEFILGCALGRRTVTCGALRIRGGTSDGLPREERVSVFAESSSTSLPIQLRGSSRLYDELAKLIVHTLGEADKHVGFTRCSSIGISTPGIINLQTGELTLSVTVPEGADIPREIARQLIAQKSQTVQKAFGPDADSEQQLAKRMYVDNDVRCIARHELSAHEWKQFACLYAGSGVGGALVINGQVHYGANASAGHIGHLELEAARAGSLPLWTGQQLGPAECDCGKFGFHLEPFASYAGLERITEAVIVDTGRPTLDLLKHLFAEAGLESDDFYRSGFPQVIASVGGQTSPALPEIVSTAIAQNRHVKDLTSTVLRAYVGILASGIVTLTHVFDPGVVVLCGPLIEQLRKNSLFAKFLRDGLPNHLLDASARPQLCPADSREAQWKGAALLAWDPSYHALRTSET